MCDEAVHVQHRVGRDTIFWKFQGAGAEGVGNKHADSGKIDWRQKPGFFDQLRQADLSVTSSGIARSGYDDKSFIEQRFGFEILLDGLRQPTAVEVNGPLAEGPVLLLDLARDLGFYSELGGTCGGSDRW